MLKLPNAVPAPTLPANVTVPLPVLCNEVLVAALVILLLKLTAPEPELITGVAPLANAAVLPNVTAPPLDAMVGAPLQLTHQLNKIL